MVTLRELAFDIGRKLGKHPAANRIFCTVERLLPVQRLGRSSHCVAFLHPRPTWQPHILVVPTTPFPALSTNRVTVQQKSELIWKMVTLARTVTRENDANWRMIINGGKRQEIGQVHGHLLHASGPPNSGSFDISDPTTSMASWDCLFESIRLAASVRDNGYSIEFRWLNNGALTASFSQSVSP